MFDGVFFTASPGGPGGASALNYGAVGGATPQAAGALPNVISSAAAPATSKSGIPPAVWMFVFLIVGYVGLHTFLKAV